MVPGIFVLPAAKHIAKTMLLSKAEAFAMQMFAKGGDLLKRLPNTAMGFAQSRTDKGSAGKVGGFIKKGRAPSKSITDKIGVTGKGGMVSKVQTS